MFTSMTLAPPVTCPRATSRASSQFSVLISRSNFFEPVTLVRSPIITKLLSGRSVKGCVPDSRNHGSAVCGTCGAQPFIRAAMARM